MTDQLITRLRAAFDSAERIADAAADAFLHGDRTGIEPYSMHPSVRMHVYTWTSARVKQLVKRDRALLAAYEKADRYVAEHVEQCGAGLCSCREYVTWTATSGALRMVVERAAEFWLGPEATDADH